ncbi:MAG: efflux RND transporter permease subunit [Woeseiaceae bacterium]
MNLAELTIRNKVVSVIVILITVIGGWSAYQGMARFEDPEFTIRTALVAVQYPGASPTEVAEEVVEPLERAIQQMQEVESITSKSSAGVAEIAVNIDFEFSRTKGDLQIVWSKLRAKVDDATRALPPGVADPVVLDEFGDVFGIYYFLTGEGYTPAELHRYAKELQGELLQIDGVAKVAIDGALAEVIYVETSRERAAALGASVPAIYDALRQRNIAVSAGNVRVGEERLLIEPSASVSSIDDIENMLVPTASSSSVLRLGDFADVWRGYETPPRKLYRFNGQPAIAMGVAGVSGGNIVQIGKAIDEVVVAAESRRPIGIELHDFYHQGHFVERAIDDFVTDVLVALAIVSITLLAFMGPRPAASMGVILLLTVLVTVATMNAVGIPMHRISLGALIIGLGMMVDNAIVVTDGILVGVKAGKSRLEAAKSVVAQSKWPLLGGTLVGIIAFAPIGFSPGAAAEYVGHLFWVILIALGFSWLFAMTLTPLFCYWFFKEELSDNADSKQAEGAFIRMYRRLVASALRMRLLVVAIVVGIFMVSMWGFQFVKPGFFPASTMPQLVVDYWLPQGTDISKTSEDVRRIEEYVAGLEGVNAVQTTIGGGGLRYTLIYPPESPNSAYGQLIVRVDDYRMVDALMPQIQEHLDAYFPVAQGNVWKFQLGPAGGAQIEATFKGPDPAMLRDLADQAKRIMADDGGALFIRDDWRQQVRVIEPIYSPVKARRAGVTRRDIATALRRTYSGLPVGVYREGDDLLPIVVRAPEHERQAVEDMRNIQVLSPVTGAYIPIGQVTDGFRTKWRDGMMSRDDRAWAIKAQSDPIPGELTSDLFTRVRPLIEAIDLPDGYRLEWDGEYGKSKKANESLAETLPLGFVAMVITVFVLFGTVRQPVIIWLVVPLALIGVVVGLLVTNLALEFMGILGLISLSGLLIKNAIVLVDQIDAEIKAGVPRFDAVVEASASRVRPVVVAALTTLGVVPLLFDAFFQSMAVVLLFGLAFATLLTLIIVPVLYAMFFRIGAEEVRDAV